MFISNLVHSSISENMKTEDKLAKIIRALRLELTIRDNAYNEDKVPENERIYKINRQGLRWLIIGELNTSTRHTIYAFMELLLAKGLISPNPTSQLSANLKKIMPTNDTRYFLNKTEIIDAFKINIAKTKSSTHPLSSFTQTTQSNVVVG